MRYRRDNADFAFAVIERITPRGLAEFIGKLAYRTKFVEFFQNFIHGNDHVWRPNTVFFQRHEFDKTHDHAFFPREAGEFYDLIFIESAQKNAVDLDWLQPGA